MVWIKAAWMPNVRLFSFLGRVTIVGENMGFIETAGAGIRWIKGTEPKPAAQQSPARQPVAPSRKEASTAASPPAAIATVKAGVPVAGHSSTDAVAEVYRQAGCSVEPHRKGGGYYVDPAPGSVADIPVKRPGPLPEPAAPRPADTVVKTHTRKPAEPTTLEVVLDQFRLHELRPLSLGKFCWEWLTHQPEFSEAEQLTRSEALVRIREGLVRQQQISHAARLDRFILVYWIATELGWASAWKLKYAAIRELQPMFGRNAANEEYCLRPDKAEVTRELWGRMLAEHLTAEQVRAEVAKIRPPKGKRKTVRIDGRAGRLVALRREVNRLKAREDLLTAMAFIQERLAKLGCPAEQDSPAGTNLSSAG